MSRRAVLGDLYAGVVYPRVQDCVSCPGWALCDAPYCMGMPCGVPDDWYVFTEDDQK